MAQENRDMRMNEAEKKAAALPPKLTVPMILFFLPVLFVVILGPAGIKVADDAVRLHVATRGPIRAFASRAYCMHRKLSGIAGMTSASWRGQFWHRDDRGVRLAAATRVWNTGSAAELRDARGSGGSTAATAQSRPVEGCDRHGRCRRCAGCPCGSASAAGRPRWRPPRRRAGRPGDGLGFGEAALQADHQRQVLPHPRVGAADWHRRAAASPRLAAVPSTARRTDRDWTAPTARPARSSARSRNSGGPPRAGPSGRARCPAPKECASRDWRANGRG